MPSILIIEDDVTFSLMLSTWLRKKGFEVDTAASIKEARAKTKDKRFDLVISDLRLPDGDGMDLLKESKGMTQFIMMTGYADIQTAVQSIKLGASDYIAKPVNPSDLLNKINEVLEGNSKKEKKTAEVKDLSPHSHNYIMGESEIARRLHERARLVAPTDMSVLITGASGTGKEYVARYIHENSNRANTPFVAVDCGAIPKELAASEFFGHIKGSFTGAIENKTGAFVTAQEGTLFLDEIGNLTYEIQVQLLRALQERKVKPIGSMQEIAIDVRVISATNEDLPAAIQAGEFRQDLYHRINEFTLRMPELKERIDDFPLFATHFLQQSNKELHKEVKGFDEESMSILKNYPWPGNLRQLKNIIRYAALLTPGSYITRQELPEEITIPQQISSSGSLRNEEHEKELIKKALRDSGYNKTKAAQILGIDRKTLYNKMKNYNLE